MEGKAQCYSSFAEESKINIPKSEAEGVDFRKTSSTSDSHLQKGDCPSSLQQKLDGLAQIKTLLERADSDREIMKEKRNQIAEKIQEIHRKDDREKQLLENDETHKEINRNSEANDCLDYQNTKLDKLSKTSTIALNEVAVKNICADQYVDANNNLPTEQIKVNKTEHIFPQDSNYATGDHCAHESIQKIESKERFKISKELLSNSAENSKTSSGELVTLNKNPFEVSDQTQKEYLSSDTYAATRQITPANNSISTIHYEATGQMNVGTEDSHVQQKGSKLINKAVSNEYTVSSTKTNPNKDVSYQPVLVPDSVKIKDESNLLVNDVRKNSHDYNKSKNNNAESTASSDSHDDQMEDTNKQNEAEKSNKCSVSTMKIKIEEEPNNLVKGDFEDSNSHTKCKSNNVDNEAATDGDDDLNEETTNKKVAEVCKQTPSSSITTDEIEDFIEKHVQKCGNFKTDNQPNPLVKGSHVKRAEAHRNTNSSSDLALSNNVNRDSIMENNTEIAPANTHSTKDSTLEPKPFINSDVTESASKSTTHCAKVDHENEVMSLIKKTKDVVNQRKKNLIQDEEKGKAGITPESHGIEEPTRLIEEKIDISRDLVVAEAVDENETRTTAIKTSKKENKKTRRGIVVPANHQKTNVVKHNCNSSNNHKNQCENITMEKMKKQNVCISASFLPKLKNMDSNQSRLKKIQVEELKRNHRGLHVSFSKPDPKRFSKNCTHVSPKMTSTQKKETYRAFNTHSQQLPRKEKYNIARDADFEGFGFDKKTRKELQTIVNSILERELQKRDEKLALMSQSLEKIKNEISEKKGINIDQSTIRKINHRSKLRFPSTRKRTTGETTSRSHVPLHKSETIDNNLPFVPSTKTKDIKKKKKSQKNDNKVQYDQCRTTVYCPSEVVIKDPEVPPEENMVLDFVHGYSATTPIGGNSNLYCLQSGELVYPVSATVVIYNRRTHKQRFFREHGEEIRALVVHPDKRVVASTDKHGSIKVWNAMELGNPSALTINIQHHFKNGICCMDFSPDGELLAAIGNMEHHPIVIWNWKLNEKMCSAKSHSAAVHGIKFNPYQFIGIKDVLDELDSTYTFITCGDRHIKFWIMSRNNQTECEFDGVLDSPKKRKKTKSFLNARENHNKHDINTTGKFSLKGTVGIVSKSKPKRYFDFTSINFISRNGLCIAGTRGGDLSLWSQPRNETEELMRESSPLKGIDGMIIDREIYLPTGKCYATIPKAHKGAIVDIIFHASKSKLLTCGMDRFVVIWDMLPRKENAFDDNECEQRKTYCADWIKMVMRIEIRPEISGGGCPSSAAWSISEEELEEDPHVIYLGTTSNSLIKLDLVGKQANMIIRSHCAMVEGLATHPSNLQFITTSKDCSLRLWDICSRKMIGHCRLPEKSTCVCFNPRNDKIVAVGLEGAKVIIVSLDSIRTSRSGMKVFSVEKCVHLYKKTNQKSTTNDDMIQLRARTLRRKGKSSMPETPKNIVPINKGGPEQNLKEVTDIKFSPCGRFLAASSKDNNIHILDSSRDFKRIAICVGHSSHVQNIDWSQDGNYLQSSDSGAEILFWKLEQKKDMIKMKPISSGYELRDEPWSTWTSTLGWPVQGIWRENDFDFVQVTCAHRSPNCKLLATGDDLSTISIFNYPCLNKKAAESSARKEDASGFVQKIRNIRFSFDSHYMLCVGENNGSIFQWRVF